MRIHSVACFINPTAERSQIYGRKVSVEKTIVFTEVQKVGVIDWVTEFKDTATEIEHPLVSRIRVSVCIVGVIGYKP